MNRKYTLQFMVVSVFLMGSLIGCGDNTPIIEVFPAFSIPASNLTPTPKATTVATITQVSPNTTTISDAKPSLAVSVKPATIKIGEEVTVTGSVSNMGIPAYTLLLDDKRYTKDDATPAAKHSLVEFVSSTRQDNKGIFVLRGIGAGKLKITIDANGEIAVQNGGQTGSVFINVSSSPFELTITAN